MVCGTNINYTERKSVVGGTWPKKTSPPYTSGGRLSMIVEADSDLSIWEGGGRWRAGVERKRRTGMRSVRRTNGRGVRKYSEEG